MAEAMHFRNDELKQRFPKPMPPHFTPTALTFLADLAKNNDRTWFEANKPTYERELKAPMLALIAGLNEQLAAFAPEHIRPPHKILMRIYRDIRFAKDKRPYKTHLAAWWSREGMEKTSGAGFYLELSPTEVTVAAGCYMPHPPQVLAIRRYLLEHHAEFRALLADKKLRARLQEFEGQKLSRLPKGFPAGHPAAELLLHRQWGISASLPAANALQPTLLKEIVTRLRLAAPIVHFLNMPLTPKARKPMF